MKKVINGKVYNTETADLIAEYSNGYRYNDFNYLEETLYRTKKGQFFIAGEGGAISKYAKYTGDSSCYGKDIELLTCAEALTWCEDNDIDADIIAEYFEVEEG